MRPPFHPHQPPHGSRRQSPAVQRRRRQSPLHQRRRPEPSRVRGRLKPFARRGPGGCPVARRRPVPRTGRTAPTASRKPVGPTPSSGCCKIRCRVWAHSCPRPVTVCRDSGLCMSKRCRLSGRTRAAMAPTRCLPQQRGDHQPESGKTQQNPAAPLQPPGQPRHQGARQGGRPTVSFDVHEPDNAAGRNAAGARPTNQMAATCQLLTAGYNTFSGCGRPAVLARARTGCWLWLTATCQVQGNTASGRRRRSPRICHTRAGLSHGSRATNDRTRIVQGCQGIKTCRRSWT